MIGARPHAFNINDKRMARCNLKLATCLPYKPCRNSSWSARLISLASP